jgi:3-hydroxybutyryl-CoA dehydrogenase
MAAARAGYRVLLEDVMPANLHHAREALRGELNAEALPAVDFVSTIEDAVREADLAIDCVPDELESKLEIFCLLDRMAPPRTILATPTTRLSIGDLAACTYRADRCVAVAAEAEELARLDGELTLRITGQTAPEATAVVREFWERVGFAPRIEVEAEIAR